MIDKELFIKAYWWNQNQNRPHQSLIEGNTETILNLGWFKLTDEEYKLTDVGEKNFTIWKENNIKQ